MFHGYSASHIGNILLHILGSLLALGAGLIALLSAKGRELHRSSGRLFIYGYLLVLLTAVLGVAVFEFRSFLTVATLAAAYNLFAGYRAIRLRGRRPHAIDTLASIIGLAAPGVFILLMHSLHKPWSPALTWSVLGGLAAVSAYDLLRRILPSEYLHRTWIQEHLYKMTGALIALISTAAATLLPQLMPWAAIVPVILGFSVIFGYILALTRQPRPGPLSPTRAIMNETPHLALEEGA